MRVQWYRIDLADVPKDGQPSVMLRAFGSHPVYVLGLTSSKEAKPYEYVWHRSHFSSEAIRIPLMDLTCNQKSLDRLFMAEEVFKMLENKPWHTEKIDCLHIVYSESGGEFCKKMGLCVELDT